MRNKLTAVAIKNAGDAKLSDGGGLHLIKRGSAGKWIYRYSFLGRRRDMGLGSWPDLSLAAARKQRDHWAGILATGVDPIGARDAERAAQEAERNQEDPTFAEVVEIVFEAKRAGLRGDGKRGRWLSPLRQHVIPKIGKKRMSKITQRDVYEAIKPIWRSMHPTALKAIQRTRIVFEEGRFMGLACDPFTVDAAKRMLGEVRHATQHIPATRWQDIPDLYQRLDPASGAGLCLRWMILTLVRFDGCHAARASEVDGDVWIVPSERVKGREGKTADFRVPLPPPAMEIVREARDLGHDLLFAGRRGRPISSRGVEKCLDRLGEAGRPHGFRTSFRTWVQDVDACSWEVSETILGHAIGNSVERSYARSDLLDRRRPVMEAWARHVTGEGAAVVKTMRPAD
jgi:integrase